MFTGIIEEYTEIKKIEKTATGLRFTIGAEAVMDDLKTGHSIAVNGVCLTVIHCENNSFTLDIVQETLDKSNLGELKEGGQVNLERALLVSDRLGGHILQGHVETLGVILEKEEEGESSLITVGLDPEWMRYCIPKGSIALDGISLTIASVAENIIKIALIPHTLKNTTLGQKEASDTLNVETDIIGKYIDRLLTFEPVDAETDAQILQSLRHVQYGES